MQKERTHKRDEKSSLSRRNFISIAAASTAATLPALALAEVSGKTSRLPQTEKLTLEERFQMAVRNLREVVQEMHPDCDKVSANRVYVPDEAGVCIIINARSTCARREIGGAL